MSLDKFGKNLLISIITNSCVDDHNHVWNTTGFNNLNTVANELQQTTQMCVTRFQKTLLFVVITVFFH